ncbi:hypothetical protein Hanom_Chr05g00409841 [Helianthus anomalus]
MELEGLKWSSLKVKLLKRKIGPKTQRQEGVPSSPKLTKFSKFKRNQAKKIGAFNKFVITQARRSQVDA